MKLIRKVTVKNPMGLHMRPATTIVKLLQDSKSQVFFSYKKATINAKSILGILMLTAQKNSKITITVEGVDSEKTMELLVSAFDRQFEEAI